MQSTKLNFNKPIIVIEYTIQAHWSTRYDPAVYKKNAQKLATLIEKYLPVQPVILTNQVPKKWYNMPIYMQLIANNDPNNDYYLIKPRRGSFEVSTVAQEGNNLAEVLFFSKIIGKQWPNFDRLAQQIGKYWEHKVGGWNWTP